MNILISKTVGAGSGAGKGGRGGVKVKSCQAPRPKPKPRKPSLLDLRTHPIFDLHHQDLHHQEKAPGLQGRRVRPHTAEHGTPPTPRTPLCSSHSQAEEKWGEMEGGKKYSSSLCLRKEDRASSYVQNLKAFFTTAIFSVSFTDVGGYSVGRTRKPISLLPVPRAELSQLRALDKDCFIIPVASLDRFLPAGVPMPLLECGEEQRNLSVLEVDDPKICLLIHLMTQMEPIEPVLESPLSLPHAQQRRAASELLAEMGGSRTAAEGMLLCNIEKNAEFPFISYYVINKGTTDPREFFHNCRAASLRKFDPRTLRYSAAHTFDLFNEVATIARPPLDPGSKRPLSSSTGFIVSLYKVFEGDDGEKFEKNWLYWTGARMIYRALPKSVGLRRITLHKSVSSGDKLYLLLVECSNFLEELNAAAALIPALRARLCGYTGLYRTTAIF